MKTITMTEPLYRYVVDHTPDPHPLLARLREETSKLPRATMQISQDQGMLMHLLTKLVGARRIVEVGCYTGYSAICMATALPEDGKLYTLDIDPDATSIATRYFKEAGLSKKIELRLAPALDTLEALRKDHGDGSFDMMFIDADKEGMPKYYELALKLLRAGGLVLCDNVLWSGRVIDPKDTTPDTQAIKRFNDLIAKDERVDRVMLTVADGLFLARKK